MVAITRGVLGTHLGLAFSDETGDAKLLHLAWHKRLRVDTYPAENWLVSVIQIPPLAASQAVALVRGMAERYGNKHTAGGVDYGINLFAGKDAVSADGKYVPGPGCDGFTCASLIAEVLRRVGFDLVNLATWTASPRNEAWGRAIVCMLRATDTHDAHVTKVESNINGLRLRPEEVAAAAELEPQLRPASHQAVQERADQIFAQVQESCGHPPDLTGEILDCVRKYQNALANLEQEDVLEKH